MKETILIITGPTASGKTGLAIECAKRFNGEIISCDSMQIYRHLDIGTAKATSEEQKSVKHHLIDIVNPDEEFSVQQYVAQAKLCVSEIVSQGKLPIIVGGTGLYIKSMMYPYSFCNAPKNEEIRKYYQDILKDKGKEFLYEILKQKDIEACKKIHLNDTKRVIRALEIFDTTGAQKTKSNCEELESNYNSIIVVLNPDNREVLYSKINARVDEMFDKGLVDEFNAVRRGFNLTEKNQSMQAIGYKELFDLEESEVNVFDIKEFIKKNSRNYAKRQITFMKGFKKAKWFDPLFQKKEIFKFIQEELNKI